MISDQSIKSWGKLIHGDPCRSCDRFWTTWKNRTRFMRAVHKWDTLLLIMHQDLQKGIHASILHFVFVLTSLKNDVAGQDTSLSTYSLFSAAKIPKVSTEDLAMKFKTSKIFLRTWRANHVFVLMQHYLKVYLLESLPCSDILYVLMYLRRWSTAPCSLWETASWRFCLNLEIRSYVNFYRYQDCFSSIVWKGYHKNFVVDLPKESFYEPQFVFNHQLCFMICSMCVTVTHLKMQY